MINISKYVLIGLVMSFIYIADASAKTIIAESCSQNKVQAAIDNSMDGDIVKIPSGSCSWNAAVSIIRKGITVEGAGIDVTIITDDTTLEYGQTPFWIDAVAGKPFRITGFTFKDTGKNDSNGVIKILGNCRNWRIDHNKFEDISVRSIWVGDKINETYGVIDNNVFIQRLNLTYQGVSILGDGDASWSRAQSLGTIDAVYVENNIFNYNYKNDGALDAYHGARYVFRYNTVIGTNISHHGYDTGNYRSPHSFEIYGNTFTTTATIARAMNFRGGTGVVFNNTISGNYTSPINVTYYRSCFNSDNDNSPCNGNTTWGHCLTQSYGRCDGSNPNDGNEALTNGEGTHTGSDGQVILTDSSKSWTLSEWVGYYIYNLSDNSKGMISANSENSVTAVLNGGIKNKWNRGETYKITNGYPCKDQIGRSTGQILSPLYEWNNIINISNADISVSNEWIGCSTPEPADHIKVYRDFFNDKPKPDYTPYIYPHPLTNTPVSPSNLR